MRRDPIWTAIEVFFGAIGVAITIGACRLAIAAVEWWAR